MKAEKIQFQDSYRPDTAVVTDERTLKIGSPWTPQRPEARGKFFYVGSSKLYARGVTYGTFRPRADGIEYPEPEIIEKDFTAISANRFNAIRTYTPPPRSILDAARAHGLYVLLGLPWEQHVTFLDDKKRAKEIQTRLRNAVHQCAGHPAILAYAIGNEIPAPIVRWLGHRRVEAYLEQLYYEAKTADPEGLVTYVNFPTTEYLHLPFLDFLTFNVYLESQDRLQAYIARLQNLAGDRPLVMSEVGIDSLRHGEEKQANVLDWQLRTAFAPGCAGAFVFSWTDEWHRGGADVEDWAFGVTTRDRRPKPALSAVRQAFSELPFPKNLRWPKISVIVCTFNGRRTLWECLDGLLRLDYANYEVIVVNDGSTDGTEKIAAQYGFRLITTENRGLAAARNTGLQAATGEIVAYIDDDASPDPHWLSYLAATVMNTNHVGVGGPNISPPEDSAIAQCVSQSPGNPVHILLSDSEAEHIPGCNMAFRKSALEAIGGFDTRFRIAGDDVDACWQLQKQGGSLGFNPGAMVWHHRRNSIRTYWKQQHNYGKAEAFLAEKWPEKYNVADHLTWAGRIYGNGHQYRAWSRGRIYQGVWGTAPFQSIYQSPASALESWLSMPEWYLLVAALIPICALGFIWSPLLYAFPFLFFALAAPVLQAILSASRVNFSKTQYSFLSRFKRRSLTAFLHVVQPLARLTGRLRAGLTLWRPRLFGFSPPWPRKIALWSEHWRAPAERLSSLESALRKAGAYVRRGGEYDKWDLQVRAGLFGSARVLMAVEEHGSGKQFVRFRVWPSCSLAGFLPTVFFGSLSLAAATEHAWAAFGILGITTIALGWRFIKGCGSPIATVLRVVKQASQDRA